MSAVHALKTALVSSIFAVSALTQAAPPTADLAGLTTGKPICDLDFLVIDSIRDEHGEKPTGEKVSTQNWNMEIYANPQTGTWSLLGRSKDAKAASDEICYLATGKTSYKQASWYQSNFPQKPATRIAQGTITTPKMN